MKNPTSSISLLGCKGVTDQQAEEQKQIYVEASFWYRSISGYLTYKHCTIKFMQYNNGKDDRMVAMG